jgi:6-phosphogluconolactonase (cycloisomerase 2 family)
MAQIAGQTGDDEGVINTFQVNVDGTLGQQRLYNATGEGPFGFTFNKQGALLTSEQFDGLLGPGEGAAAGYSLADDGTLTATSPSVRNGGTDSCWFVVTDSGRYGYVTSFFGTGRISSYVVGRNGSLELLDAQAADEEVTPGASDLALSRNSRYLYQLNSFDGTISAFAVGSDGSLTLIQKVAAHAPSAMAAPLGLAAS